MRYAWFTWIGVGLFLEAVALWTAEPGDTLTETTVDTLPGWLVIGFLVWAVNHFKERYERRQAEAPASEGETGAE